MSEVKLYKGVWVRPSDASDKPMVNECLKNYVHFNLDEHSRVLDLGSHIGTFSVMCRNAGVRQYLAYEANRGNYEMVRKNIDETKSNPMLQFEAVYSAISASTQETVTFYHRPSKQASCSGSISPKVVRSNLTPETVPNAFIDDVVYRYNPTHLKMDIEGAEREILELWDFKIPSCVREFSLEIHSPSYCKDFADDYTHRLETQFELVAATPVHGFFNKGKNWSMFGREANSVLYGFDLFYRRR
jgi:FkbM family methyltransferase